MDVPEITPLDEYDPSKARLVASLKWLISKAGSGEVATTLYQQPFSHNQQGEIELQPALVEGLTSAELYCKACANIFRDSSGQWTGHWNVIQTLSRKGVYVMEENESAVTDSMLTQTQPFKLHAHLALIEALMTAYAGGVVSVERVVQAVRRFASFNASSELPYDVEDALLFWINKVCATVRKELDIPQPSEGQGDCIMPARPWVGKAMSLCCRSVKSILAETDLEVVVQKGHSPRQRAEAAHIPTMEDFLKDLGDGCCLATLVSFYCPGALKLEEISLTENVGIADSLHNLSLLRTFCERHIPTQCFHLTLDDLLYTHEKIKRSLLALVAELFYWFEVQKAECVRVVTQDQKLLAHQTDSCDKPPKSTSIPQIPISNVTKRSFQQNDAKTGSNPDLRQVPSSPTFPHRQPLLPKRYQQGGSPGPSTDEPTPAVGVSSGLHSESAGGNIVLPFGNSYRTFRRSNSLTSADDRDVIKQSVIAWENSDEKGQGDSQANPSSVGDVHPQSSWTVRREGSSPSPARSLPHQGAPTASPSLPARSGATSSTLLGNVSIDSALSDSTLGDDLGSSISLDLSELEETPRLSSQTALSSVNPQKKTVSSFHGNPGKSHQADDMRLESVSARTTSQGSDRSNGTSCGSPSQRRGQGSLSPSSPVEPLMAAKLRPAKEKLSNHTKQVESGEVQKKRSPSTPTKPNTLMFKPREYKQATDSVSSSSDDDFQTPSLEVNPAFPASAGAPVTLRDSSTAHTVQSQPKQCDNPPRTAQNNRKFDAFYVDTQHGPIMGPPLPQQQNGPVRTSVTTVRPAHSFTLHDKVRTPEAAKAAGIPVVDSREGVDSDGVSQHDDSRSSGRSSGEFSDQELRKINRDHRYKENSRRAESESQRPGSLSVQEQTDGAGRQSADMEMNSPKTSFAQIKKMRENGDSGNSNSVNVTTASQDLTSIMKTDASQQRGSPGKTAKKTTFAALPNQTTWQESLQRSAHKDSSDKENRVTDTLQPLASELVSVKMRLEEKRREIEMRKKKIETQMSKQRQQLGKEAFLSIVSKGKSTEDVSQPDNSESFRRTKIIAAAMTHDDVSKPRVSFKEPQASVTNRPILEEKPAVVYRDSNRSTPPPSTQVMHQRGSPRSQSPRVGSDSEKSPRGKFTKEEILETIDTVKQKYLKENDTTPTPQRKSGRPKSYHEDQIQTSVHAVSPPRDIVVHRSHGNRPHGQRPKSFHAGVIEGHGIGGRAESPLPNESSEDYGSSLDKLNKSLSELQGEIMKLSIQQEQIKTLSDSSPRTRSPSPTQPAAPPISQERHQSQSPPLMPDTQSRPEHFYMTQQASRSQPDLSMQNHRLQTSAGLSQSHGSLTDTLHHHQGAIPLSDSQPHLYTSSSQGHYPHPSHSYSTPYMLPPGQYPTPPQQYMQPGYSQYPGMPPNMPPSAYQQTAMYQQPPGQGMYPQHPMPQPPYPHGQFMMHGQQPGQPGYPGGAPYPPTSTFTPQPHMASTYTVSASPHDAVPSRSDYMHPAQMRASYDLSPGTISSPSDSVHSFPEFGKSDLPTPSTPKNPSPTLSLPTVTSPKPTSPMDDNGQRTPVVENGSSEQSESQPSNKGFFISFGEDATPPRRSKPKLRNKDKKDSKHEKEKNNVRVDQTAENNSAAKKEQTPTETPDVTTTPPKPKAELIVAPPVPVSPAVGFMIGEEENEKKIDDDEIQKKKEKILQMQIKRKEEQEKKRLQREQKMSKKAEEQRLKEEKAEQKKAEEKARRETIYQQYLQRKAEQDEEDGVLEKSPPKKSTPKAKPAAKAKAKHHAAHSHGPSGHHEDKNSVSSHSQSSQEDLSTGSKSAAGNSGAGSLRRMRTLFPSAHTLHSSPPQRVTRGPGIKRSAKYGSMGNIAMGSSNNVDGGFSLAYGGLTHRRPPTPPHGRRGDNNSDSGSNLSADYAGPKLFVKPSSKSNRHIICNAISHCCLAGVVNRPVKDAVLEVIEQSEAKHFVILFRDGGMMFRALYTYDPESEEVIKIHGTGPRQLVGKMYEKFYKYNSGIKSFTEVKSTKHLSVAIDAVVILNALWQKKAVPPSGAARKPGMR